MINFKKLKEKDPLVALRKMDISNIGISKLTNWSLSVDQIKLYHFWGKKHSDYKTLRRILTKALDKAIFNRKKRLGLLVGE